MYTFNTRFLSTDANLRGPLSALYIQRVYDCNNKNTPGASLSSPQSKYLRVHVFSHLPPDAASSPINMQINLSQAERMIRRRTIPPASHVTRVAIAFKFCFTAIKGVSPHQ